MCEDPIDRVIRESRAGVDPIRMPHGDFAISSDGTLAALNRCRHLRYVETCRPARRAIVYGKGSADCQCLDCGEMFLWVD